MRLRNLGLYAGLALAVLAACDDDDDVDVHHPSPQPEPQPAADAGQQPAPAPVEEVDCSSTTADSEVVIDQLAYMPAAMTISQGDVIQWSNEDVVDHTVTSGRAETAGEGDVFDSMAMSPGDTFCLQFNGTGSFPYHCDFHPTIMNNGMVTVE